MVPIFIPVRVVHMNFNDQLTQDKKKRHLVKFMSLCLPDGYCLDTLGPFFGTQNDATITNHITKTRNTLAERWRRW